MTIDSILAEAAALSDRELALRFESLGDNCELGLVQRQAGAEPLGLLRFAGSQLPELIRAMNARFAGIADPAHVNLFLSQDVYMVRLAAYGLVYHTHKHRDEADPTDLLRQQSRTVTFLARKLVEDLENPGKIFVFRQNEPLAANDLLDLRACISRYGKGMLLWIQEARPGHPAGSVDWIDDRLMTGYVRRLASRANAPDLDLPSWMITLRRAWTLWRIGAPFAFPRPARIDLRFGIEGNARGHTEQGWSPAETDYVWAVDGLTRLRLETPAAADTYRLDMMLIPYEVPPALPTQRLEISVNGEPVHVLDPVPRGDTSCLIPGHLIRDRDHVDIVFTHPRAASPASLGGDDMRRLGVCFYRLSLSPAA